MILRRSAVRGFRLAAIVFAVWLLRGTSAEVSRGLEVDLETARVMFPQAERRGRYQPELGASLWLEGSRDLGYVLRTSPEADSIVGYSGPNDVLVGLDPGGRVVGVSLVESRDTREHVEAVRAEEGFWRRFEGWRPGRGGALEVDAVAGSTLTSLAIAEAVELRLTGRVRSLRFSEPVRLEEAQQLFLGAASLEPLGEELEVLDARGQLLGYLLLTSPYGDGAVGYRGPSEALIGLQPDRASLAGIQLRASYDTPEYVERVRRGERFLDQLARVATASPRTMDFGESGVEGVSGATQTSYGLAEAVRRRLESVPVAQGADRVRDLALALIVVGALALSFGKWRSRRGVRLAWQTVLVVALGLLFGELLSLARLVGWARHGAPLESAPGALLLVGVALFVPWASRRQVYCQALCPHGALQEWVGRVRRFRVRVPRTLHRALLHLPGALLVGAFLMALCVPSFELAHLEAFDAWVLGAGALISLVLALVGLVACLWTPMAYCRFACPTGALLGFVRTSGSQEGFRTRDAIAAGLLLLGAWLSYGQRPPSVDEPSTSAGGWAFGTEWSLKLRPGVSLDVELERRLHAELERIEATCSSWRPDSELSQFNASETTLPVEPSAELFALIERSLEWHSATGGAYDPTVAPLLDAWGVGPAGPREGEPSQEELEAALEHVGATKLVLDAEHGSLAKSDGRLRLDLGSLLQGYAADRLAGILAAEGHTESLVDVGGELVARGAWTVAIEDPRNPGRHVRNLTLEDCALATSGSYRMQHIVSPTTGERLASPWILCAVRARGGLIADGWATALLASGERAREIALRENLDVLLVATNGEVTILGDF